MDNCNENEFEICLKVVFVNIFLKGIVVVEYVLVIYIIFIIIVMFYKR